MKLPVLSIRGRGAKALPLPPERFGVSPDSIRGVWHQPATGCVSAIRSNTFASCCGPPRMAGSGPPLPYGPDGSGRPSRSVNGGNPSLPARPQSRRDSGSGAAEDDAGPPWPATEGTEPVVQGMRAGQLHRPASLEPPECVRCLLPATRAGWCGESLCAGISRTSPRRRPGHQNPRSRLSAVRSPRDERTALHAPG